MQAVAQGLLWVEHYLLLALRAHTLCSCPWIFGDQMPLGRLLFEAHLVLR